ncbi:MAG TPA: hypothetical protein PLN31_19370 [Azoarcus taiwanensis]|nr:hypothetical protein [Azoarcus taiwanensis]
MPAMTLHHPVTPFRPAAARPMRSEAEPESCEPELALWVAALVLLIGASPPLVEMGMGFRDMAPALDALRIVT